MDEPRRRAPSEVEYGELPELTRATRALGSGRRSGGAVGGMLQSEFFMPLLDARRKAAEARSAVVCLRAFDAIALSRALDRSLERIIVSWPDERPSVRRAIRAELRERVSAYTRALDALSHLASVALAADEPAKLDAWRNWTVQLAATFDAADRSWIALRSVVESLPSGR